jgi:glycerol-3-phosphate dehydrogenase
MRSVRETVSELPGLNREGLVGSAVYFDAQVEFAERLVVENVLAAIEHGATVRTYTRVSELLIEEGVVAGACLEGDKTEQVRAKIVINAAGPWVDQLLEKAQPILGEAKASYKRLIGGRKGSHVVVAPFVGAPQSAVYLEAVSDRRPLFIIPWNGNYLMGTTDVRFEGDPDRVRAEEWEVEYLLSEANRAFPQAALTRERVLYTYSGVRPLPFTRDCDAQSITRRHFLREHPQFANLISVVGGKLTTYRSLAEECVDLVLRKLGRGFTRSETAEIPLPGGSRAEEIAELAKPLNTDVFTAEIVFVFEREFAKTLADCFLRRTMMGLNADRGLGQIEAAAEVGRRFLGWTEDRAKREVEAYREEISRMNYRGFHGGE